LKKALFILWIISVVFLSACGKLFKPESTPTPTATATAIPTRTATPTPTATITPTITPTATLRVENRISGLDLDTPLQDYLGNETGISEEDLRTLLEKISPYTNWIRTYSIQDGTAYTATTAHELGLKFAATASLGKNLEDNASQMEALIELAKAGNVDLAIIGNETLLRGDLTARELQVYIDWFKSAVPNVRVTTTDVWSELKQYSHLLDVLDVVAINIYPDWEESTVEEAMNTMEDWYLDALDKVTTTNSQKQIMIAETSWPACGEKGDAANQAAFFNAFVAFAQQLDIQYFWFEAYDKPEKTGDTEGAVACWGLWDDEGRLKTGMENTFNGQFVENTRSPKIRITNLPAKDEKGKLSGIVLNVDPDAYRVVVYIYVPDAKGWWVKPQFSTPYTYIHDDGTWSTSIFTGGIDDQATMAAAYLIPNDYAAPLTAGARILPAELLKNAIASTVENRQSHNY
jgi:exo-beta-1,3-glucanase (GH17 family)